MAWYRSPAISPDGEQVAFVHRDVFGENLYVRPADNGLPERAITSTAHSYFHPRWSPDGSRLMVYRGPASGGGRELVLADPNYDQPIRSLGSASEIGRSAAWFPDGERLLLYGRADRSVAVMNVENGRMESEWSLPDSLSPHSAVVSPDGLEVAVTTTSGFYRWTLDGRGWTRLTRQEGLHGGLQLLWSDDGFIYFNQAQGAGVDGLLEPSVVWRIPAAGGTPEPHLAFPMQCPYHSFSLARDAMAFACTVEERRVDIWIADDFDPDGRR